MNMNKLFKKNSKAHRTLFLGLVAAALSNAASSQDIFLQCRGSTSSEHVGRMDGILKNETIDEVFRINAGTEYYKVFVWNRKAFNWYEFINCRSWERNKDGDRANVWSTCSTEATEYRFIRDATFSSRSGGESWGRNDKISMVVNRLDGSFVMTKEFFSKGPDSFNEYDATWTGKCEAVPEPRPPKPLL